MHYTRRAVLQAGVGSIVLGACPAWAGDEQIDRKLQGQVGVTTGSFMAHLSTTAAPGKIRLLDVPRVMRDELDLRVLDLMTRTLASMQPAYLEVLRQCSEDANCIITNLKMNQPGLDMASPEESVRAKAMEEYKRTIDAAQLLGCRWVRPLPGPKRPDLHRMADSYKELIDYAGPKDITLLIENFGWLSSDPDAIPEMIKLVGAGLHAQPDTGNWDDATREAGLTKAFPAAVSCDFKAFPFDKQGNHARYDLQRCFEIGWEAGFRGPWCLEHFSDRLDTLLAGMIKLRDMLRQWMQAASAANDAKQ